MTSTLFLHLCLAIGQGKVPKPHSGSFGGDYLSFWWSPDGSMESWQVSNLCGRIIFRHSNDDDESVRTVVIRDTAHLDELLKEIKP